MTQNVGGGGDLEARFEHAFIFRDTNLLYLSPPQFYMPCYSDTNANETLPEIHVGRFYTGYINTHLGS